jgi:ribonuclease HI
MNEVVIYVDGATRKNPGPAAIAAVIKEKQGKIVTTVSGRIGISTNNGAEYRAIILGLERAITLNTKLVEVLSDSELIVNQIHGKYHVRTTSLIPLYKQVKKLEDSLDGFTINHIPRQYNNEAHDLAHKTLSLVEHIGYAQNCQLIIILKQTDNENGDRILIHQLIGILNNFPGKDEVKLSISSKDKTVGLNLSNIRVNYCYELRIQLKGILGRRQLIVKQLK